MDQETVQTKQSLPAIREDLLTGIDVGGTKIQIADSLSATVHRYNTADYANMDVVLEHYFEVMGARPVGIAIGMAGPRDDETGEIKLTNGSWPIFNPRVSSEKYDIKFATANDMVVTAAGVLKETGVDLLALKSGTPAHNGTKLVVALSTGFGAAAAVWDHHTNRYVILAGEGGHIGFQPKNEEELDYLRYLHGKYPHASAELALAGKHGIDNLVDHCLQSLETADLANAIARARESERPVGSVLLEYATEGQGIDQQTAQKILRRLGAMIGSVLRDLALVYKATGGIYLTGSIALALGEYFAAETTFGARFVHKGARHNDWLERIPISLVTDPDVAAVGALSLAAGL